MIQKKICLLGSFAAGKTSLVSRFVHSVFSEKYLTTVGVKIDKKVVDLDDGQVKLMLWDLAGEDDYTKLRTSYLRGASGYLLIIDGTRANTLYNAFEIQQKAQDTIGEVPFVVLINKADLIDSWEVSEADIIQMKGRGWIVMQSSAKTGESVEEAFTQLTQMMV